MHNKGKILITTKRQRIDSLPFFTDPNLINKEDAGINSRVVYEYGMITALKVHFQEPRLHSGWMYEAIMPSAKKGPGDYGRNSGYIGKTRLEPLMDLL